MVVSNLCWGCILPGTARVRLFQFPTYQLLLRSFISIRVSFLPVPGRLEFLFCSSACDRLSPDIHESSEHLQFSPPTVPVPVVRSLQPAFFPAMFWVRQDKRVPRQVRKLQASFILYLESRGRTGLGGFLATVRGQDRDQRPTKSLKISDHFEWPFLLGVCLVRAA